MTTSNQVTLVLRMGTSQFKQKFLFVTITFLKDVYKLNNLTWNLFATSHGKGAVNGVGGTIKRLIWSKVLAGKAIVTSANSFYERAKVAVSSIQMVLVSPYEMECENEMLEARWEYFQSLPPTHSKFYCIEVLQPYTISCP